MSLDFRQNIDYFCSVSLTKIVVIKATAELLRVSEHHRVERSATRPEPAGPEILSGFGSGFGLMFNG